MKGSTRVGLFQAHWRLHSSTCYIADRLAAAGHGIDLFLFDSDEELAGEALVENGAITVHRLGKDGRPTDKRPPVAPIGKLRALYRLLPAGWRSGFRRGFDALRGAGRTPPIPAAVEAAARDRVKSGRYLCLIGVEKGGLAWAGAVARDSGTPLVYYSLELYTRSHPFVSGSALASQLKASEEKFHRQARLTLVQDRLRAKVLLDDNGVGPGMPVAFLPVSIPRNPCAGRSRWLNEELKLPEDVVIVLVFGLIHVSRLSLDLARQAQSFPDDWKLVFHGPGTPETIERVRLLDGKGRVRFSHRAVPMREQWQVVGSARISLVFYKGELSNDRLTGRSSEKIALSLQCGVPIVAFRYESYEHLEQAECGIFIDSLDELREACARLLENYAHYSRNARAAYERYYCFESEFEPVLASLEGLGNP